MLWVTPVFILRCLSLLFADFEYKASVFIPHLTASVFVFLSEPSSGCQTSPRCWDGTSNSVETRLSVFSTLTAAHVYVHGQFTTGLPMSEPLSERKDWQMLIIIANNDGSCRLLWVEVNSLTSWVDLSRQAQSLSQRHWCAEDGTYFTWHFQNQYISIWVGGWTGGHLYDRRVEADITEQWFSKGVTLIYILFCSPATTARPPEMTRCLRATECTVPRAQTFRAWF